MTMYDDYFQKATGQVSKQAKGHSERAQTSSARPEQTSFDGDGSADTERTTGDALFEAYNG